MLRNSEILRLYFLYFKVICLVIYILLEAYTLRFLGIMPHYMYIIGGIFLFFSFEIGNMPPNLFNIGWLFPFYKCKLYPNLFFNVTVLR